MLNKILCWFLVICIQRCNAEMTYLLTVWYMLVLNVASCQNKFKECNNFINVDCCFILKNLSRLHSFFVKLIRTLIEFVCLSSTWAIFSVSYSTVWLMAVLRIADHYPRVTLIFSTNSSTPRSNQEVASNPQINFPPRSILETTICFPWSD